MAEKNQMRTENIKKASELFKDGRLETLIKSSAKFESEAFGVKRALEEKLKALENAKKQAEQQAVVVEEPVKQAPAKKEEPKVVKKEAKDIKTEPKAPKMELKKATAVQSKSNSKKYHLIVASLTTQEDAQRMLKTYHKQGYTEAKVLGSNGRFRISLCNYAEQATATRKLNDLKQKDAFKNAWMLTSK